MRMAPGTPLRVGGKHSRSPPFGQVGDSRKGSDVSSVSFLLAPRFVFAVKYHQLALDERGRHVGAGVWEIYRNFFRTGSASGFGAHGFLDLSGGGSLLDDVVFSFH